MNSSGDKDNRISPGEAKQFARMRLIGRELVVQEGSALSRLASHVSMSSAFASALRNVRARTLDSLHKVRVFASLSPEQLELLLDSLEDVPFEPDQFVFDQGKSRMAHPNSRSRCALACPTS